MQSLHSITRRLGERGRKRKQEKKAKSMAHLMKDSEQIRLPVE